MYCPLVSVIIPVYKVERFLHRCIDSVIHQTYTNWEMILVDDGSPDTSGDICDEYAKKDKRIKVIHQENQGVSGARNKGLDMAQGEWIYFLDSDDYIKENTIEKMVAYSEKGKYELVIAGEAQVLLGGLIKPGKINEACDDIKKIKIGIFKNTLSCSVCNKLINSYIFKELRFPVGQLAEDAYIMGIIGLKIKTARVIPDFLYYYNVVNSNSTTNGGSIENSIRFKYGRYLNWIHRSYIAQTYYPDLQLYCLNIAISHGINALCVNQAVGILSDKDVKGIKEEISKNKNISLSMGKCLQRYIILSNFNGMLKLLGQMHLIVFYIRVYLRKFRQK